MKYLKKFSTDTDRIVYESGSDYIEPYVSLVSEDSSVHYNNSWADDYFTTVAREDGTISFNIWKSMGTSFITSISYSTDNGETWITTNNTNNKEENLVIDVNVNKGDKVLWKGNAMQLGCYDSTEDDDVGSFFSSTCEFDTTGNIMSLLYSDNFNDKTTFENTHAFCRLFSDYNEDKTCKIVNANNLILPATTLTYSCYQHMFIDCTSLTTTPELLATTLADCCCYGMFYNCINLITAPKLPATILAHNCYYNMFYNCTKLTTSPELPATTLLNYCYYGMFQNCTNLTSVPKLPAITLSVSCYHLMFNGCTSLTTAPELPATTLASQCYVQMFNGCTSLNYIKAMFTTTPSKSYTDNWVSGVASSGTFIKNSNATWNVTGNNGVPTGWTVQTASE